MRAAALAALALAGCSASDGGPDGADSTLVAVLAEVQLAGARASLDSLGTAAADSLRRAALEAHGWDAGDLEGALDALARAPDLAKTTYDAVDLRLGLEKQGVTPAGPAPEP